VLLKVVKCGFTGKPAMDASSPARLPAPHLGGELRFRTAYRE
jgi:hypothetical protein